MITDAECLQLAALLHDIGKFRQRTIAQPPYGPHEKHGWEFVTKDLGGFVYQCGPDVGDAILHHHRANNTKEIEKQVILADWLSAKERETEEREREQPSHTPLVSIMSRLKGATPKDLRYNLNSLEMSREGIFPTDEGAQANPEIYARLWSEFTQALQRLAGERGYQSADYQTIVALLHKYTTHMPSATPGEGEPERTIPDVSLYDHLRTTAAIAACIYHEVRPDELDCYLKKQHQERPLCALIKGDISGIQKFLYQIQSEGASRELRGRSFYLQLLTEAIALWMLRKFNLPITNLIFASGGHFYLLAPYTRAKEELDALRAEITEKLWRLHQDELSIILADVPVTPQNFESDRERGFEAFTDKWDIVSKEVNSRKQKKWSELTSEKTQMGLAVDLSLEPSQADAQKSQ
ncbi:type III-A CRISPR-associated protein Cas10/Csm1 [Candidatus Poribacteria bacterium]|nr:type III-A CRISPR-associated protein Cas10/Csm1 [Candidatus Poribacteria bacterium]